MNPPDYRLAAIVSYPLEENTYVLSLASRGDCVVFDPGLEPEKIVNYLESERLTPAAILCTHGHSDHIAGNWALKDRWPACPIGIGRLDAPMLTDTILNFSAPFGLSITSPPADLLFDEGDVYQAAGMEFLVREVPGHSEGHIVFIWRQANPPLVFGGDVLFQAGIGRFDLPGGNFGQLQAGIHEKLFVLPDATRVLPGHGEETTIGEEKRYNPFVGRPAGYRA